MLDLEYQEAWKPVPDYPGYEVSDHGRVRSYWVRKGSPSGPKGGMTRRIGDVPHFLTRHIGSHGYPMVQLANDKGLKTRTVHSLVLEAFVGPCPDGMECLHENRVRADTRLTNIRWGTPVENTEDKRRHGTMNIGSRNGSAKMTEAQVADVLRMAKYMKQAEIVRKTGVSSGMICLIVNRKIWKHVECD